MQQHEHFRKVCSGQSEKKARYGLAESEITVEDTIAWNVIIGERFPQLLRDPFRSRIIRHTAMKNLSLSMVDDKKDVEHADFPS
jgi:hypothetical protein